MKDDSKKLEEAACYALGCLGEEQAARMRDQLAVDPDLAREVASLKPAVEALGLAAPDASPPEDLRQRLKDKIASPGIISVKAGEGQWTPLPIPGVFVKRLMLDRKTGRQTSLVRIEAGCAYPPHRHASREESLVLEGDLKIGGHSLKVGDYMCAEEGSTHGVLTTEGGCMVLIMSSIHDQRLPAP
ncbi:MAG: cupin domain-containing protein [Acidobacteriota bacterium]|nr:cupin domain-containing protein [Acidobacteriota bacterium]